MVLIRILWHSNAPWCGLPGTGYGQQTAIWAPRFASLGREVAISAFYGLQGARTKWNGHLVYPVGFDPFGSDVIPGHARHFGADLLLTLCDVFALDPDMLRSLRMPVACWMPIDTDRLGLPDQAVLQASGAQPVAMSRHGERVLAEAGFSPLYVPHGLDSTVFAPQDKAACRERLGLPQDAFIAGINAANKDRDRKGFPEMFAAFAALRARHPDALLLVHSSPAASATGARNLAMIAQNFGIQDAIRWADPYSYPVGAYTAADMAAWYGALDLYLQCSWAEGFGLTAVEAQLCGVPVVVTDCSAMTELAGPGWLVGGEPAWTDHLRWWCKPYVGEIAAALDEAYDGGAGKRREASREFALQYDANRVLAGHWVPALKALEDLCA